MEEKSLTKIQNQGIFSKIKKFLKKIFGKNTDVNVSETNIMNTVNYSNQNSNIRNNYNMKELLNLQYAYETGKISADELSIEEKDKLISFYKEQIYTLNSEIDLYKKQLNNNKNKIISIRNKLANKAI